MRIEEIHIENFRSIKTETIKFPSSGILALVWPNNAWKSNILRAIDNIIWDSRFSWDKADLNDFYMKNKENDIKIKITFDNWRYVLFNSSEKRPEYIWPNGKITERKNTPEWSSGNVKDDFPCTYLSANRSLEQKLQFRSYELMWKIAKKFQEKTKDKKEELENKFNEIMSILDQVDGFKQFQDDFCNYFDELQSDSPYKLKVSFKAFSPLNYFKTINILANDSSVNDQFDIDTAELWEWNKSLMLFALIRSYAKNFKTDATWVLAIEEPEIYLHPQARRHLYSILQDIVKNSNIQIIYTTHSPDFISTEEFSSIWLVSKDPREGTKVKLVTEEKLVHASIKTWVSKEKINESNIKDFYAVSSNYQLNEWFFAKHLLLVEWSTEELCLPILFKKLQLDCYANWISIIWVEGKNQIPKYWRLFKLFNIKVSVIFDSDDQWNNNICNCFNCKEEDIEMNVNIIKKIETKFQNLFVFEWDFEAALKKDFNDDENREKYYDEAINIMKPKIKSWKLKQSKAQVARYIVNKIISNHSEYIPSFLSELVKEIK